MLGMMAEAVSLRSFSTLWYWIALAAFWAHSLRAVMGLPHKMVARARLDEAGLDLLEAAAQVQAHYRRAIWQRGQVWITALLGAALGALTVLAFAYGIELAAALWFIAVPALVFAGLDLRMARQILAQKGQGAALVQLIFRFNIYRQLIAMASILVTVCYGFIYMAQTGYFG